MNGKTAIVGLLALNFLISAGVSPAQTVSLESPNGQITLRLKTADQGSRQQIPVYDVHFNEKPILSGAEPGIAFQASGVFQEHLAFANVSYRTHDETYPVINGKTAKARNHFNELTVLLEETVGLKRQLSVTFRAYDDGLAFRCVIPEQDNIHEFVVTNELSHFVIPRDPIVYYLPFPDYANSHEGPYEIKKLSGIDAQAIHIDLPVLLEYDNRTWLAITEASLVDYAGLFLRKRKNANTLESDLTPHVETPTSG